MPGRYLAGLAEILLIGLVGFQCMTLFGTIVTPLEPPPPGGPERPGERPPSTILSSYDPFFAKGGGIDAPRLAATDLRLHGVRQDGRTGGGSAIVSEADGTQRSVGVGEAISPGIVLKGVGPGYATVSRHGADEPPRLRHAGIPDAVAGYERGVALPNADRPASCVRRATASDRGRPAGTIVVDKLRRSFDFAGEPETAGRATADSAPPTDRTVNQRFA